MQLVAYGAQDVYLTGNPKVTFFQAVYRRHTNFAMENIEQTVNGTAANNGRVSVTIARNGDLISDMYIQMKSADSLKEKSGTTADCSFAAERAIKDVELSSVVSASTSTTSAGGVCTPNFTSTMPRSPCGAK